jgi:hypothetical protein
MVPSEEDPELNADGMCELCSRLLEEERLTRYHHLPRSHARKMKRRRMGRQEFKRRNPAQTVALCDPCHRNVHVSVGNADLARGSTLWRRSGTISGCDGSRSGCRTSRTDGLERWLKDAIRTAHIKRPLASAARGGVSGRRCRDRLRVGERRLLQRRCASGYTWAAKEL